MNFDSKATAWDNETRIKRAKIIADQISEYIEISKDQSALEFGSGTGLISFNLQDKLKDITCIDLSQGMIDVVNEKITEYQVKNMTAYQYDVNQQDHSLLSKYNLIYTSMALHHIVDIEATVKNLYSLLETGGYLCIVDLDAEDGSFHKEEEDFQGHNGFQQEKLQELLEKVGFAEVESHTFYHDQKIVDGMGVDYSLFIMWGKKI